MLRHRLIATATTEIFLRQSGCPHARADRAAMAGGEVMLSQDVQAYLAVRRAMGFAMKWSGNLLPRVRSVFRSSGPTPCLL